MDGRGPLGQGSWDSEGKPVSFLVTDLRQRRHVLNIHFYGKNLTIMTKKIDVAACLANSKLQMDDV